MIKPLIGIEKSAINNDRWSFGCNIAHENYGNGYSEYYLVVNFLYWVSALGFIIDNRENHENK